MNGIIQSRYVTPDHAALRAAADDLPAPLRLQHPYRHEQPTAVARPVTGVYVDVKRVEAHRAVIAAAGSRQRRHLGATVDTGETGVATLGYEAFHA